MATMARGPDRRTPEDSGRRTPSHPRRLCNSAQGWSVSAAGSAFNGTRHPEAPRNIRSGRWLMSVDHRGMVTPTPKSADDDLYVGRVRFVAKCSCCVLLGSAATWARAVDLLIVHEERVELEDVNDG